MNIVIILVILLFLILVVYLFSKNSKEKYMQVNEKDNNGTCYNTILQICDKKDGSVIPKYWKCVNDKCERVLEGKQSKEDCEAICGKSKDCTGVGQKLEGDDCICQDGYKTSSTKDGKLLCLDKKACNLNGYVDAETNKCVCDDGYTGEKCEEEKKPDTKCNGVGQKSVIGSDICICKDDFNTFYNQNGELYCLDKDVCNGHGTLENGTCKCEDGYIGADCLNKGTEKPDWDFKMTNNCTFDIFPMARGSKPNAPAGTVIDIEPVGGTKIKLAKGESITYKIPKGGMAGTKFWAKYGCDDTGKNCAIGEQVPLMGKPCTSTKDCNDFPCEGGVCQPPCPEGGCHPPIDSIFEATWGCREQDKNNCTINPSSKDNVKLSEKTFWDTSAVDGWTIPYAVKGHGLTSECDAFDFKFCKNDNTQEISLIKAEIFGVSGCPDGKQAYLDANAEPTDKYYKNWKAINPSKFSTTKYDTYTVESGQGLIRGMEDVDGTQLDLSLCPTNDNLYDNYKDKYPNIKEKYEYNTKNNHSLRKGLHNGLHEGLREDKDEIDTKDSKWSRPTSQYLKYKFNNHTQSIPVDNMDLRWMNKKSDQIVGCVAPCKMLTNILSYPEEKRYAVRYCCPTPLDVNTGKCTYDNGCMTSADCNKGPIKDTAYYKNLKSIEKPVYTFAYDDADALHNCDRKNASFEMIFCPPGSVEYPKKVDPKIIRECDQDELGKSNCNSNRQYYCPPSDDPNSLGFCTNNPLYIEKCPTLCNVKLQKPPVCDYNYVINKGIEKLCPKFMCLSGTNMGGCNDTEDYWPANECPNFCSAENMTLPQEMRTKINNNTCTSNTQCPTGYYAALNENGTAYNCFKTIEEAIGPNLQKVNLSENGNGICKV